MYPDYFGLSEASFSITPDPQYLFLSQRHREALAHLLYGTTDGGGFVLLTGEVGTGKTTVCRAFLEQSPEHVDVALILNPSLSVNELLQAICQEFGVEVTDDASSNKSLLDKLNEFLLQAHAENRRPVLMIDEAQNLEPEVLEQIRLLTNLETTKHKLLQIFLVGQPELRSLLQKNELRQLAQRITARYHLTPLNEKETAAYIQHRLAVAGVERALFDQRAIRQIYRYSHGIPRLINILCDRALLGTYATHKQQVTKSIVNHAARELRGEDLSMSGPGNLGRAAAITLLLGIVSGVAWMVYSHDNPQRTLAEQQQEALLLPEELPPAPSTQPESSPSIPVEPSLLPADTVEVGQYLSNWKSGLNALLALWGVTDGDVSGANCSTIKEQGLYCREISGNWNNIRRYNRPVLLKLHHQPGIERYALVSALNENSVTISNGKQQTQVPISVLDSLWLGEFTLLWKPSIYSGTLVSSRSTAAAVMWLNAQLDKTSGILTPEADRDKYDSERVKGFQKQMGLKADGIAGPDTLIHLNAMARLAGRPWLVH